MPDSLLAALGDTLVSRYGVSGRHTITANEGAAVALAAGHYLATGRPAMVYLQNSGIGNIVNPVCSLMHERVYAIPVLLVVGWRGEPGVRDEPQHAFQGQATLPLLEALELATFVLDARTSDAEFDEIVAECERAFVAGRGAAIVVRKDGLTGGEPGVYTNMYASTREEIVNAVVDALAPSDIIVSTTGKLSRELFEAREARGQGHGADFLTVGSMGHASMIGLGVALERPGRRVVVMDGDGAALMHAGSLATIGAAAPSDFVHVVVNNESHESVGGMPTAGATVDFCGLAAACGYRAVHSARDTDELVDVLAGIKPGAGPVFIEVKSSIGARADLGRPTTTPAENRDAFMRHVRGVSGGGSD